MNENVNTIINYIGDMLNRDSINDEEKLWMESHIKDHEKAYNLLKKLKTSDIHLISIINRKGPISVKKLPKLSKMSQPTVSRTIKRFAENDILNRYYKVQNSKETVVALTITGKIIAMAHVDLEKQIYKNLDNILSSYPKRDVDTFIEILNKIKNLRV